MFDIILFPIPLSEFFPGDDPFTVPIFSANANRQMFHKKSGHMRFFTIVVHLDLLTAKAKCEQHVEFPKNPSENDVSFAFAFA